MLLLEYIRYTYHSFIYYDPDYSYNIYPENSTQNIKRLDVTRNKSIDIESYLIYEDKYFQFIRHKKLNKIVSNI